MKFNTAIFQPATSTFLPLVVAALAVGTFILDLFTDLELATAALYVSVVLLSSRFCQARGVLLVAMGCIVLTILGYFFTYGVGSAQTGLINGTISLLTIAITAYLTFQIAHAQAALLESRAQLAHAARLTALGELSASIAHEVNQPLTAIVTSGEACLRWLAAEPANVERAKQGVDRMVKDANRASEVIARVRKLANRAAPHNDLFNMNEVILEVISLTRTELQQNCIALKTYLADDIPTVSGDRIQFQQVLLNLIINSIEALNTAAPDAREISVTSSTDDGHGVYVAVRDSGAGPDPANVDRLFEPFFTTKSEGMGIGLTISRTIIEAHGGRIWAAATPPRGAIFHFTVPGRKERDNEPKR